MKKLVLLAAVALVTAWLIVPAQGSFEPAPSIAVLPFVNMSSDPEQEYFSDGLTEEILNRLAQLPELRVAGRTPSFKYREQDLDLREVAAELGVSNILEGSVRKSGNRIRATAQLIKADDGFHLWSDTYEYEIDDIFRIQDEIALSVVDALKVNLLGEERQRLTKRATTSVEAVTASPPFANESFTVILPLF